MRTKDVKNFICREKILFLSKALQLIDRQAEQAEHMLREQIRMKTWKQYIRGLINVTNYYDSPGP